MRFLKSASSYEIQLTTKQILSIVKHDDNCAINNKKPLCDLLLEVDGVIISEYDPMFGAYVFITIEDRTDTDKTHNKIKEVINAAIKRGSSFDRKSCF